ncbi:hypothetical protein, partial [Oceanicoccus sp.]|uniref:hypothetical protein n=1 Tax=Oceanicoccus sp. TaxID=2691044 RepID=UPI00262944D5
MTEYISGMTEYISGMTEYISGMTEYTSGMTEYSSGMTRGRQVLLFSTIACATSTIKRRSQVCPGLW